MQAHGHVQNSTEKDPTQAVTPYCSGLYICLKSETQITWQLLKKLPKSNMWIYLLR